MIKSSDAVPAAWPSAGTHGSPNDTTRQRILLPQFQRALQWIALARERRSLADLADDDRLLQDIGVTRSRALHEAAKPFWQR